MALYLGEAVTIFAAISDPLTGEPLDALTVSADFYAPGKDPVNNVTDRNNPDITNLSLTYDASLAGYKGTQPTSGGAPWVEGKWHYRVKATGGVYDNFEFGAFTLRK